MNYGGPYGPGGGLTCPSNLAEETAQNKTSSANRNWRRRAGLAVWKKTAYSNPFRTLAERKKERRQCTAPGFVLLLTHALFLYSRTRLSTMMDGFAQMRGSRGAVRPMPLTAKHPLYSGGVPKGWEMLGASKQGNTERAKIYLLKAP